MTWDLSKLYSGFDAPEYVHDIETLKKGVEKKPCQLYKTCPSAMYEAMFPSFGDPLS